MTKDDTTSVTYPPIRDLAAIGDCHGSALVSRAGDIEWCTLKRFDADPVFCRLLDARRGGFFGIRPAEPFETSRRYLGDTNILETEFSTATGKAVVIDFMPVGRSLEAGVHDYVDLRAPWWLVRRIQVVADEVTFKIDYRPSSTFAAEPVSLSQKGPALRGEGVPPLFAEVDWSIDGDHASASVSLSAGQQCDLVLAQTSLDGHSPLDRVDEFLNVTKNFWTEWIGYCRYRGPHEVMVRRSALALKLLTYAPSGALVAALTTSLPEEIGGERNWDYRFSWLRDSSFALYALAVLGYAGEARRYHQYLASCVRETLPRVQIMYGIGQECDLAESTLDHLEGYAASRPVRVGNGAFDQDQIDVYGEILDLAFLYEAMGGRLETGYRRLLEAFVDHVELNWCEPDQGLWEMRGPPRHHVHGKLMSWVAMDRAASLFDRKDHYRRLADEIERDIKDNAVDPKGAHLRQAYDGGVDAAVLLAPMLGFPSKRATMEATIAKVEAELGRGDFLLRYAGEDGLEGGEGAFLICSFWLVDALLSVGEIERAKTLFESLLGHANDVGLYAEEVEPASSAFLGNFPQAFTHLALIGSAVNLALVERHGPKFLSGSYGDRARRAVEATLGWRGVWAAIKQSRRLGRLTSSPRSKLAWP